MQIGTSGPETKQIKEADHIVTFAKAISREIGTYRIGDDVNFMGCSMSYVEEKITIAINDLRWLKTTLKAADKLQRQNTARRKPEAEEKEAKLRF